jgi:2-polyprenyl-6-methoxyphenol hydroxylase-like FAD-dependent oxidoreductase
MSADLEKPHVLIVGGGLGGLMLGALLEKAAVPYLIFERATTVKPLGTPRFLLLCYANISL